MSRRDELLKLASFVSKLTMRTIDGDCPWERVSEVEIASSGNRTEIRSGFVTRGKDADVRILTDSDHQLAVAMSGSPSDNAFVLQFVTRSGEVRSQWPGFPGLADLYNAIDRGVQSKNVSADIAAFGEVAAD